MIIHTNRPIAYVSGPITADCDLQQCVNVRKAAELAAELCILGYSVFCPHTNAQMVGRIAPQLDWNYWIDADLAILGRCNCVVMVPGWEESKGAVIEHQFAKQIGLTVYYQIDDVPTIAH